MNRTEEKGKRWERDFNIFPDSGIYREAGHDSAHATVADPLDDAAFLYWIRTDGPRRSWGCPPPQ